MPEPVQDPPGGGVGGGDEGIGAEIDVEEGALRALEEDALVFFQLAMEPDDGVGDVRGELPSRCQVGLIDFAKRKRRAAEGFEDGVVFLDAVLQLRREYFRTHKIDHAQAGAGGLVAVGRADAALGGADLVAALAQFARFVEGAMVGQHKVGRFADEEAAGQLDAPFFEPFDFRDQGDRINDHAVGDDAFFPRAKNAGGDEVEDEFFLPDLDGVAGVVAALGADDDVGLLGEDVDDFSFSFIAPLGADKDGIHGKMGWRPTGLMPDAGVGKAEGAHFLRIEEIASVEEEGAQHALLEGGVGERLELGPFREDEEGVGAFGDVFGFGDHPCLGNQGAGFFHRFRIVGADFGALGDELLDDGDGHAAADVVGIAFEGEAENADFFLPEDPEGLADFLEEAFLLVRG